MSRTIKFRVWNYTRDEMSYDVYSIEFSPNDDNGVIQVNTVQDRILFPDKEAELMQFTGLLDKHGAEIYEGDIVNIALWDGNDWTWEEGVIKWYQPSSAFKWFSLEEDPSDGHNYWLSQADEKQRQIIGNIYENPELLNKN